MSDFEKSIGVLGKGLGKNLPMKTVIVMTPTLVAQENVKPRSDDDYLFGKPGLGMEK